MGEAKPLEAETGFAWRAINELEKDPFASGEKTPFWRRFFLSSHTRDITVTMFFILAFILLLSGFLWFRSFSGSAGVAAALIGASGAALRYLYDLGNQRIGMADALASDILSIGRVFLSARLVDGFADAAAGGFALSGFANKSGRENYFEVYDKYIDKIGSLNSECVRAVTAFYTFLRASRDATKGLELWDKRSYTREMKQRDIINIIYQCLLLGANGEIALRSLREDNKRCAAAGNFVLVQIQSITVLNRIMPPDDYRRFWIDKRVEELQPAIDLANSTILKGIGKHPT